MSRVGFNTISIRPHISSESVTQIKISFRINQYSFYSWFQAGGGFITKRRIEITSFLCFHNYCNCFPVHKLCFYKGSVENSGFQLLCNLIVIELFENCTYL